MGITGYEETDSLSREHSPQLALSMWHRAASHVTPSPLYEAKEAEPPLWGRSGRDVSWQDEACGVKPSPGQWLWKIWIWFTSGSLGCGGDTPIEKHERISRPGKDYLRTCIQFQRSMDEAREARWRRRERGNLANQPDHSKINVECLISWKRAPSPLDY